VSRAQRCETCRFWERGGAAVSAAWRRADGAKDIGTCNLYPPEIVVRAGVAYGVLPEMPQGRFCGEWQAGGNGGGDGETVVPFGRPAA